MRKNKFFTFVLACLPGAGQMYQGLLKRGISLMLLFWGIVAVSATLYLPFISFALPVVWFYAFFDAMNRSNMTVDELRMVPDRPILVDSAGDASQIFQRRHIAIGATAIVLGLLMIYNMLSRYLADFLRQYNIYIYGLLDAIPVVVVSVVIICFGVRLIKGTPAPKNVARPGDEVRKQ